MKYLSKKGNSPQSGLLSLNEISTDTIIKTYTVV